LVRLASAGQQNIGGATFLAAATGGKQELGELYEAHAIWCDIAHRRSWAEESQVPERCLGETVSNEQFCAGFVIWQTPISCWRRALSTVPDDIPRLCPAFLVVH
jgi:hypothetical protein